MVNQITFRFKIYGFGLKAKTLLFTNSAKTKEWNVSGCIYSGGGYSPLIDSLWETPRSCYVPLGRRWGGGGGSWMGQGACYNGVVHFRDGASQEWG